MSAEGPLSGVRILDLPRAMAGPFCTQLLGDLGAEVIKVKSPHGGDESRYWGPFWNGISCYYLSVNRNKRSIVIDLKSEAGLKIALKLAQRCDVLIENFRPGTMDRLGLGYETLSQLNPALVHCSLSGFGPDGPRAQEPAYDLLMQGFSGLMSLTGFPDGTPVRAGLPVTDLTTAMFAAFAIVSALYRRRDDGVGQKVETSLLEGQVSWLSYYVVGYFASGVVPQGMGSAHHSLAPYRAYEAEDGHFVLAVGNDVQWQRLCGALEASDLAEDPRFATNKKRIENRDALDSALGAVFGAYSIAELSQRLTEVGVPCGPINSVDDVVTDRQVQHMEMVQSLRHPDIPDLRVCGVPIAFSRTPGGIRTPPPGPGEDTDQVLRELGCSDDVIAELRASGAVA